MSPNPDSQLPPRKALIAGRILSVLSFLFMLLDAVMKLVKPEPVLHGTSQLGFPENTITPIGVALLVSTVLYAIPRTAVFGAILLTGYLGGAVAANVRVGSPLLTNALFPVYFAILAWGGLVLRSPRVKAALLAP